MHKIIHSSFEIDLYKYNISTVEENHWFSDQFFTKYSFPFDIHVTEDLEPIFGDFLDHNNTSLSSYYEIKYVFGNVLEDGILQIETQTNKLSATLRYGFNALPNFDKNLSELPLEVTTITDIFAHAKTIISQTWPAVNYNYPQIHTDKYDPTDATWATFLKIINNYDGTNFLTNSWIPIDNRNVIQPTPYLLHILTQGFLDAGYTLKGDITTNALIKKICVFADLEYYSFESTPLTGIVNKNIGDFIGLLNTNVSLSIPNQKWRVTGTVTMYAVYNPSTFSWDGSSSSIVYKTNTLWNGGNLPQPITVVNVDAEFTADGGLAATQILVLSTLQAYALQTGAIFDLTIEKVSEGGANEIHVKNEVDLTKVVPDITFGALVSDLKNNLNIDLDIVGNDIYMNFIENSINNDNAMDLTQLEVSEPKKSFNSDKTFLLKFRDVDNAPTPYLPAYQSAILTEYSDKKANKNTNIIEINALPLPNKALGTVNTAFSFEHGGNRSVYFLLYNGLTGGLNYASDPSELFIPSIHPLFYNKWLTFRVNAKTYNWLFKMFSEGVNELGSKLKVFAYGQYHIVKTLNKHQLDEDLFEVEIETETL